MKKVQLSGKCVLKIDTIVGKSTIEVPKKNLKGENNADALINEVIHFGVMRHGKNKFLQMVSEELSKYEDKFNDSGLSYPEEIK